MDLQIIITIVFTSSLVTFILGWLKEIDFDKKVEKRRRLKIQEDAYKQLLQDMDFIYEQSNVALENIQHKKKRFIENYRLLFLHAPDVVIVDINEFLKIMTNNTSTDNNDIQEKKRRIAESMITMRKQLISKTKLRAEDFRHIV